MNKKSLSSLCTTPVFMLGLLLSFPSMAERPYATDDTPTAPAPTEEDQRPAAQDASPPSQSQTQSTGDTLAVPATKAVTQTVRKLDFPRRGMTQDQVEKQLGRPIEIVPAVGKPPISRWVYDDRTVYFEYSSVIHVVAK